MSTSREKARSGILVEGLGKPVDLNGVDWHVRENNPSASPLEVQNETLEIIQALVSEGLFMLGAMSAEGEIFTPWNHPLDKSMHEISHTYVKHYDDPRNGCIPCGCSSPTKAYSSHIHSKRNSY